MERKKINDRFFSILNLYKNTDSPQGLTKFYATMTREHSPLDGARSFLEVSWSNDPSRRIGTRLGAMMVIEDLLPNTDDTRSGRIGYWSRFLLKQEIDTPLIAAIVAIATASYDKKSPMNRINYRQAAEALISTSGANPKYKLGVMELFRNA